ncbi:MAG: endonuclease MutS2 [Chloroflexota bacterium]
MDAKSLEMLEFPQVRQLLAGYTSFSTSREQALALLPVPDPARLRVLLGQSAEARQLLSQEPNFGIGGLTDIREEVGAASLGIMLEPGTLLAVKGTLAALRDLRAFCGPQAADFPLLWNIVQGITPFAQIERDIGSCIDPSGEVLDSASPQLASIRQQLRETRQHLMERLENMVNATRWRRFLQDTFITERDGRYVIPVKIESRHEIKGIIHDISNTAATVFIEPTGTVGMGNALRELVIAEKNEVERILGNLSMEVGACHHEIAQNIVLAADFDLALAKARFAAKMKAAEPVIVPFPEDASRRNTVLKLVDARHPLLFEKAVPFSVEIGDEFLVLLITGPNTGGKTVTLKTMGLLSLMAQAGMPITAAPESTVPVFDNIFADIGDEQSIEQTLSTFSWHISNIVRITTNATARSMVLLDELGTSTDPTEGTALARAILHYFLSGHIVAVATTHFSDLKAYAYNTTGMQNASLEFDPATLKPTYRLTVGVPGGSNALATAARLGLPEVIINEARDLLPKGSQQMEELLTSIMAERERVAALRGELAAEQAKLRQQNEELAAAKQKQQETENQIIQEIRDHIVRESAGLQKELRQAAAELRRERSAESLRRARESLASVQSQLRSEAWQPVSGKASGAAGDDIIRAGDTVWWPEAGLTAMVLSVFEDTRQAEVQAGTTKIRLDLDALTKATPPPDAGVSPAAPLYGKRPAGRHVSLELDLRGKRADEVEPLLDTYLNDAVTANLAEVRIIHGIGTGALRQIVRDFLATHPLTRSFRSGARDEGGDGVTVARL